MSRWLSSVNSLLENLDGQAETVAETVAEQATTAGISNNLRRLNNTLASNASALTNNISLAGTGGIIINNNNNNSNNSSGNNSNDIDSFDDDDYDDEYEDDDAFFQDDEFADDGFEDDDKFSTDEGDFGDIVDFDTGENENESDSKIEVDIVGAEDTGENGNGGTGNDDNNFFDELDNVEKEVSNDDDVYDDDADLIQPRKGESIVLPPNVTNNNDNEQRKLLLPSKNTESNSSCEKETTVGNSSTSKPNVSNRDIGLVTAKTLQPERTKRSGNGDETSGQTKPDSHLKANDYTSTATHSRDIAADYSSAAPTNFVEKLTPSSVSISSSKSPTFSQQPQKTTDDPANDNNDINKRNSNSNLEKKNVPPKPPTEKATAELDEGASTPTIAGSKIPTATANNSSSNNNNNNRKNDDDVKIQEQKQKLHQQQQMLASKNKTIQSLQSELAKFKEELAQRETEKRELKQKSNMLDEKLHASEREVEAQAKELVRAGEEMEQIRTNAKEEREDILDDHEDEMEDLQRDHQAALDKMRQEYETTIAQWKERYESEEALRQQEGGDSIRELRDANQREKEALKKLAEITAEKENLQSELDQVVGHETTLQQQVESSLESAETVAAREQRAREELDEATALHAKQMAQRQAREAELEQTILEMGSALTLAKQELQQQKKALVRGGAISGVSSGEDQQQRVGGSHYKEQFEQVAEQLDTVRVQLTMETQRREALQQELVDVSREREQEFLSAQTLEHQHDRKVADLESTIHRLQDSIRAFQQEPNHSGSSNGVMESESMASNTNSLTSDILKQNLPSKQELEAAKREITHLSEELLRQQTLAKNAKSEILTLKGRLQAANSRADEAENASYNPKSAVNSRSRTYDIENGGNNNNSTFLSRRRIKGGSSRGVRSIRSALPCFASGRSPTGGAMDQVVLTIDAIDSWMVDTGSFMRHEPFARLGLLLYLMILHLWSFALVIFHTTEVEHGDFGSMDSNPRHWREHS